MVMCIYIFELIIYLNSVCVCVYLKYSSVNIWEDRASG